MGLTPYRVAPHDPSLAAIHSLIHTCFATMEDRINPPSSVQKLTLNRLKQHTRDGEIWTLGRPPIGCMVLTPRPDCLYLGKLCTAANVRHQGHARRLIDQANFRAKALNLPAIELQSRVELAENHLTFRKLGFQEIARTAHAGFDEPTSITFRRAVISHIFY